MKNNNKTIGFYSLLVLIFCCLVSCNSFLDEMPDNRAEIKGVKEINDILVSAYTNLHPQLIFEKMSDNVTDNGALYGTEDRLNENMYLWEDTPERSWDSPHEIWGGAYSAIANANQALEKIKDLGFPEEARGAKAEALLCRAYHHFLLSTVFCMAYDDKTAGENLGLPYITEPEKEVGVKYDRGTLKALYEKIDEDIEDALKDVAFLDHDVPLYHFNKNAAYAFAARFNLFYKKDAVTLQKAVDYATMVVGDNPFPMLRNLRNYSKYTKPLEWTYGYINKIERANLMLITNRTRWGTRYTHRRYGHSRPIAAFQTFWSTLPAPYASGENVYNSVFGNDQNVYVPKLSQIFEITNVIAQTGQPHVVVLAFTTDETLLCRAEANILLEKYDQATSDLKAWYRAKGSSAAVNCTTEQISAFYQEADSSTVAKPLSPNFEIKSDLQRNMLHAVLHARRIEGIHEGTRFVDIKRYGIQITHKRHNDTDIVLEPHDLRTAVQIPSDVLSAGFQANPRKK